MILISPLIDNYFLFRLKKVNYRKECYVKALNKQLRVSKIGVILLRNLNEVMSKHNQYHDEFVKFIESKDYQQAFWESDLGFLWYQGNLNSQNEYFNHAISEIKINNYS